MIKAQYKVLTELKRVDEKVGRFQLDIGRIPEEIAKLDEALASRKAELDKHKGSFDTSEKALRALELELKEMEDHLRKAESKMMEVKTNEEYQAAMKENEGLKADRGKVEEKILVEMSAVDEKRKATKDAETQYKQFETVLKGDKKKLEDERAQLGNLLETQLQLRTQITGQLEAGLLSLYQRLAGRVASGARAGSPIAVVENGMCLSCHMIVRPQLYNEILGYKHIHTCPTCGKILLPRHEMEAAGPSTATH